MSRRKVEIRHPGSLKKYGFSENESERSQMKSIRRADREYGRAEVNRKLAALETFNKRNPWKRKRVKNLIRKNGGR